MATLLIAPSRRGVSGHLRLVVDVDGSGQTRLREQSFCPPVHVGKAYRNGATICVNVVTPTAGFLSGDRLETEVRVCDGGRLFLTTPAATRVHTMEMGEARVTQLFSVDNGGFFEYLPEPLILQRGSRFRQETVLNVAEDGTALYLDYLAPGRVAYGENLVFDRYSVSNTVRFGGRLSARERYVLDPSTDTVNAWRKAFVTPYVATWYAIGGSGAFDAAWCRSLCELETDGVLVGATTLRSGGAIVRLLSGDNKSLRDVIRRVRVASYEALGTVPIDIRRT